jgi:hypothetical protein
MDRFYAACPCGIDKIKAACPSSCPCWMSMSVLHVRVHAHGACSRPWCMSQYMLRVHVHAARPYLQYARCRCPICMSCVYAVYSCPLGCSDFDKIFENCYASCSFGLTKYIEDRFRMGIFLHFVAFLSFWILPPASLYVVLESLVIQCCSWAGSSLGFRLLTSSLCCLPVPVLHYLYDFIRVYYLSVSMVSEDYISRALLFFDCIEGHGI